MRDPSTRGTVGDGWHRGVGAINSGEGISEKIRYLALLSVTRYGDGVEGRVVSGNIMNQVSAGIATVTIWGNTEI